MITTHLLLFLFHFFLPNIQLSSSFEWGIKKLSLKLLHLQKKWSSTNLVFFRILNQKQNTDYVILSVEYRLWCNLWAKISHLAQKLTENNRLLINFISFLELFCWYRHSIHICNFIIQNELFQCILCATPCHHLAPIHSE